MKRYCVGFAFNQLADKVLLIRKARPEWMKDLLNGLGGKVEEGETPLAAMEREFVEESGIVNHVTWSEFATLNFPGYVLHFFVAVMWEVKVGKTWAEDDADAEPVEWYAVDWVRHYPLVVDNLLPLLILARQFVRSTQPTEARKAIDPVMTPEESRRFWELNRKIHASTQEV